MIQAAPQDAVEPEVTLRIRADEQFRKKASADLHCPNLNIRVETVNIDELHAVGCEQRAVYVYTPALHDYVLQSLSVEKETPVVYSEEINDFWEPK